MLKVLRDPIYEYIAVTPEELRLIDSPWFQRLRHCSQNGPARLVYPSLLGTRFEHSLGVMELADRVLRSALDKEKHYDPPTVDQFLDQACRDFAAFLGRTVQPEQVQDDLIRVARMAGLCHDLGHFPLSHTVEAAFEQKFWLHAIPNYWFNKRACHEAVSAEILRQVAWEHDPGLIEDWLARAAILVLMSPPDVEARHKSGSIPLRHSVFNAISSVLIGDYDVDRLDYLQRDGRISGAGFGQIDLERVIKSMMLVKANGQFEVMPTSKALSTIETVLLERYKEFKWVVFHHKVVCFNEITVEVARDVLAASAADLFRRIPGKAPSPDNYRDEVLTSLGRPGTNLPALNLYLGDRLGLKPGPYVLNGRFFVNNDDMHLLDDGWFALKFRAFCKTEPKKRRFYLQALVDRRKCSVTLWKDLAQFRTFHNSCVAHAGQNAKLAGLANLDRPDKFPSEAGTWLTRVWASMRQEGSFGETTCQTVEKQIQSELAKVSKARIRCMIALVKWSKLFGKLADKKVLGRRNSPDSLLDNSNLLSRLAGLEGEIPFFAFVLGEEADLQRLFGDTSETERLQATAKGFIRGIVSCWINTATGTTATGEFRGAWVSLA